MMLKLKPHKIQPACPAIKKTVGFVEYRYKYSNELILSFDMSNTKQAICKAVV